MAKNAAPVSIGATDTPTDKALSYEEAFQQLEVVLSRLEAGDLPLEESLELFERGAALAALCANKLDEAELRVRKWQPGDVTEPFEDWRDGS